MAATWRRKDFGRAWRGPDICRKEKKGNNFITFLFKNLVRCLYKRSHGACYYERLIFIYILFSPSFFFLSFFHSWFLALQLGATAQMVSNRSDRLSKSIQENGSVQMTAGGKKAAPSRNARV